MIDEIEYGKISIEGESFKDVKIINKVPSEWTWKKDHKVTLADIQDMLDTIDVLVIGTGQDGKVEVEKELAEALTKLERGLKPDEFNRAIGILNTKSLN